MPLPGFRDKDVGILRSRLRQFSLCRRLRVFGSRANGTPADFSDLDCKFPVQRPTPAERVTQGKAHKPCKYLAIQKFQQILLLSSLSIYKMVVDI
jgi:hypothetical protein